MTNITSTDNAPVRPVQVTKCLVAHLKNVQRPLELWRFEGKWRSIGFYDLSRERLPTRVAVRTDSDAPAWTPSDLLHDLDSPKLLGFGQVAGIANRNHCCKINEASEVLLALMMQELSGCSWWVALPIQTGQADLMIRLADQTIELLAQEEKLLETEQDLARIRSNQRSLEKRIESDRARFEVIQEIAHRLERPSDYPTVSEFAVSFLKEAKTIIDAESIALVPVTIEDDQLSLESPEAWSGPGSTFEPQFVDVLTRYFNKNAIWEHEPTGPSTFHIRLSPEQCAIAAPIQLDGRLRFVFIAVVSTFDHQLPGGSRTRVGDRSVPESQNSQLLSAIASMMTAHGNSAQVLDENEDLTTNVIRALVTAIDAKDEYTRGHSERVALYGRRLAQEAGFDAGECQRIYLTGLLHDIGKIAISDAVLKKPTFLTDDEFREIMAHPDEGWAILCDLRQLNYVLPGVLHHHERFDGKGYPDGLAGEDIPIEGRILAIADGYDAMTSDRPYRSGMPQDRAIEILKNGAGPQWDPNLVELFLKILPEIELIRYFYLMPAKRKRTPSVGSKIEP